MLTKNAVGNLINRYKAVLGHCRLLNVLGALALAGTVVLGGVGEAWADTPISLNDVTANGNYSPATVQAGTLSGNNDVTFSGIAQKDDGSVGVSIIESGSKLTLTGDNTYNELLAKPASGKDSGTITNNGTLVLGSAGATTTADLYGSLTNSGTSTVLSEITIYDSVESSGTLTFEKSATFSGSTGSTFSVTAGTTTFKDDADIAITTNVAQGATLLFEGNSDVIFSGDVTNSGTITVNGDSNVQASFIHGHADAVTNFNGDVDTAATGMTINNGIVNFAKNLTLGSETFILGDNGTANFTGENYIITGHIKSSGTLTFAGTTTLNGSFTATGGTVTTHGAMSISGPVTFEGDSKFIVEGSVFTTPATVAMMGDSSKSITIADTSTLELKNVGAGEYIILDGFGNIDANHVWTAENVSVANILYTATGAVSNGDYIVTVALDGSSEALASVGSGSQASLIGIASDANNPAFTQVDTIMSDKSVPDRDKAVAAEHMLSGRSADATAAAYTTTAGAQDVITSHLSSALNMSIVASNDAANGVFDTSTMTASADVVSDMPSTSYINKNGANEYGMHVWAMPFYQNNNSKGLESNSTYSDAENNFGGLVLGADKTFGDWRIGLAINAGSGGIKAKSDYATTDTDYDFFGFNLYAGRSFGDFGFTALLGYSHGSYESYIDQSTAGADQEIDMTSHTYAVALRGTYAIDTGFADLTPYLGLNFMHFVLEDCDLMSVSGTKTADISTEDQDIWTVPFGVTISKDFSHNDWTLTPAVELGGIFAMGDLDSHASSRAGSAPAMDVVADVVDDWTFDAGLSLTAIKGVATINLGYDLQVSEHMTNHGVFAKIGYSF